MPCMKPSKNDQIHTKLLPDAKIGAVPRGTQFSQIPMLKCAVHLSAYNQVSFGMSTL